MTRDTETRRCVDEITGLLHTIQDPAHLSSVHDWVVKLTAGEPNARKTDHLRLLEYTLKCGGGVRKPFTVAPPDGPLACLSGLARRSRTDSLAAGGGVGANDGLAAASKDGVGERLYGWKIIFGGGFRKKRFFLFYKILGT